MPHNMHRSIGTRLIQLSSRMAVKTTGAWTDLGGVYSKFALQCVKSTASSNFSVKLQGTLSTKTTSPFALLTYTQANVSQIVRTTAANPPPIARVRFSSTTFTTGAGKGIQIWLVALP